MLCLGKQSNIRLFSYQLFEWQKPLFVVSILQASLYYYAWLYASFKDPWVLNLAIVPLQLLATDVKSPGNICFILLQKQGSTYEKQNSC